MSSRHNTKALLTSVFWLLTPLLAETGRDAWLRYAPLSDAAARPYRATLPAVAVAYGTSPVAQSARNSLLAGVRGMLGRTLRIEAAVSSEPAVLVGTLSDLHLDAKIEP